MTAADVTAPIDRIPDEVLNTIWHSAPQEQVLEKLRTGTGGLDDQQVQQRRESFGPNVMPAQQPPALGRIILHQFLNPLIYILVVAGIISAVLGEFADAIFILLVILLNAALGAFQEWRAERRAQALQQMLKVYAVVRRDGQKRRIEAEDLVPGDIVLLESGDRVPADLRLLRTRDFATDESFLTGESVASHKHHEVLPDAGIPIADRLNMAYAGSTVTGGRATGVVVATGLRTEIGGIAEAVTGAAAAKPPLVIRMERFVRVIGFIVIGAAALLALVGLWQGRDLQEVFFLAVALAVSAIPEGLPVAITVALSVAVYRMAGRHVIVRKMPAVEGLGSCTYLASDKTGTLTVNKQTVKLIWLPGGRDSPADGERFGVSGEGYTGEGEVTPEDGGRSTSSPDGRVKDLARAAAICNDGGLWRENGQWKYHGDAVDVALLAMAFKAGLDPDALRREAQVVGEIPFESERKFAAKMVRRNGRVMVAVKGAVERLVEFSRMMVTTDGEVKIDGDAIEHQATRLAEEGYRVLAVAWGEVDERALAVSRRPTGGNRHSGEQGETASEGGAAELDESAMPPLRFLGLVGMIDPLRPEAKPAVGQCREAGVEVAMITGDHPATAAAISMQLGIIHSRDEVMTGQALAAIGEPGSARFAEKVRSAHVFARVAPLQKLHIIEALNRHGHFTAVTGDGVNDAPALRKANIGVAMGSGTEVAKDAAPIIVTDDNFASIVSGIEEGRFAYSNIRKVIYLLVSTGAAEIVLFLTAILARLPLPLLPVQILWLNLVTNGIQDLALAFEKGEPEVMKRRPRGPAEGIFNRLMIGQVAISGATMGLICFAVWWWLIVHTDWETGSARNLILLLMVLFQNFHLFNTRSEHRSAFCIPLSRNWLLVLGTLTALGIHLLAMQIPLMQTVLRTEPVTIGQFALVALVAASVLAVMEVFKWTRNVCRFQ